MSTLHRSIVAVVIAALLASACAGAPVALGTRADKPVPVGTSRTVAANACGFQLLLFIPIAINERAERAYKALEAQAAGDYITDVQVEERWSYAFIGTIYCTSLKAKAIRPQSS